jgi:hypothetical protein
MKHATHTTDLWNWIRGIPIYTGDTRSHYRSAVTYFGRFVYEDNQNPTTQKDNRFEDKATRTLNTEKDNFETIRGVLNAINETSSKCFYTGIAMHSATDDILLFQERLLQER